MAAVYDKAEIHAALVLRAAAGPILIDAPDAFLTLFNSADAVTLVGARTPEAMRRETAALGLENKLGRLNEGARANLVIYDRASRAGIKNLMSVRTVIVGGAFARADLRES